MLITHRNSSLARQNHSSLSNYCLEIAGYALVAVLLATAGKSFVDATIRATHSVPNGVHTNKNNNRQYLKSNNSLFTAASTSQSFGPDVLDGYLNCGDFKADIVPIFMAIGKNFIQEQKDINCNYYDYYTNGTNDGSHNSSIDVNITDDIFKRRLAKETSYGTNNKVFGVEEDDLIKSDGTYIFIGQGDMILVTDLNGKAVVNITLHSSPPQVNILSYTYLTSLFINNNILTALTVNSTFLDNNQVQYTSAFMYQFQSAAKTLELINKLDISTSVNGFGPSAHNIGHYTYVALTEVYEWIFNPLYRCSSDYLKILTASDYEKSALANLDSIVSAVAQEVMTSALNNGAAKSCNNIIKVSSEAMQITTLATFTMTQVAAFAMSTDSPDSFETSTYFVPFVTPNYYSVDSIKKITNDSILIAASSPDGENSFVVKFSVNGSVLTPKAVGVVEGAILTDNYGRSTTDSIDAYNGLWRIATVPLFWTNTSQSQIYVLEENNSQLEIVGQWQGLGGGFQWVHFEGDKGFVSEHANGQVNDTYYYSLGVSTLWLLDFSSTKPTAVATEINNIQSDDYWQFIDNGKYMLVISNSVSKVNATGIAVKLFQVTGDGIQQLEQNGEWIFETNNSQFWLSADVMGDRHTFRYLPESHKLVISASAYNYYNYFRAQDTFEGFLVYDVNLKTGVKYIGNVTHFSYHDDYYNSTSCLGFSPRRSMVFNGDLITFAGHTMKSTSTLNTLDINNWETDYCM